MGGSLHTPEVSGWFTSMGMWETSMHLKILFGFFPKTTSFLKILSGNNIVSCRNFSWPPEKLSKYQMFPARNFKKLVVSRASIWMPSGWKWVRILQQLAEYCRKLTEYCKKLAEYCRILQNTADYCQNLAVAPTKVGSIWQYFAVFCPRWL